MPTVGQLFCDEALNLFRLSLSSINWQYPAVWKQLVIAGCLDLLCVQLVWCLRARSRGKASPFLSWLLLLKVSVVTYLVASCWEDSRLQGSEGVSSLCLHSWWNSVELNSMVFHARWNSNAGINGLILEIQCPSMMSHSLRGMKLMQLCF